MDRRFRSRREELTQLRGELRAKGATYRHIAQLIAAQEKVNSRVAFRLAHGMTQQQVAEDWNRLWPSETGERTITHKHISYWESWPGPTGRAPTLDVLNRLARIYQCRAADLMDGEDHSVLDSAAWSPSATSVNAPLPAQDGINASSSDVITRVDTFISSSGSSLISRESDYQCLVRDLTDWACRLNRRDILQWLSSAAAAAAAAPVLDGLNSDERDRVATAFAMPQRMDESVIDHIEAVLWRCLRQDDALGPRAALDTVLAQHRLIRSLLPQVPDALRRRLLSLYADFSGLAGWLSFDLNSPDAADSYYETARTAAHEAHNTKLGALILCNLSQLATWRRRPRVGIDHAVAAQGWALQTRDFPLQAFSYDVAAHAYAMDGDSRAALNAIEQARQTLAVADPQQPTLIHFYGSGQLASTESNCLLRLGKPGRAIEVADLAMRTIDPSFVRNLAMVTLRLGDCRLELARPDVPAAAQAIGDAAQLAARNHSVRLARRLDRSWHRLSRWQDVPEVRAVRDRMVSYRLS